MKICTRCKVERPIEDFGRRRDRNGKPYSWCDTCRSTNLDAVLRARKKKQDYVANLKREAGCAICGFNEPVALDYHHLDPTKKSDNISELYASHSSLEKILLEIEKCVLLCANHHRLLHAGLIELPL